LVEERAGNNVGPKAGSGHWLEEMGIQELQGMMEAGDLTAGDLVLAYYDRIARYDKGDPGLNTILELNPDALHIAGALDLERRRQGPRGLLHGVPVLVKDNIDTADKMHTSAGSQALANSHAREDSHLAAKLREAGAIILGKANMTEWANFMTHNMPNGYSSRGGQVLNPYGPGVHDVGGSSSGSGAAVAANLVMAAIGTETSGSILSPAGSNSIVGIKPTVGLISRRGVIPISQNQDTAGPMARTVTDAAILLGALTGVDPRDPATFTSRQRHHNDYTGFLDPAGLKGARLGVPRIVVEGAPDGVREVFTRAVEAFETEGATLIHIEGEAPDLKTRSLVYEFKPCINAYLGGLAPEVPVHSLAEVIEFNSRDPKNRLKHGQTILIASENTSGTLTEPEYLEGKIRELRLSQREGIDRWMAQDNLDALVFPHNYGAAIAAKAGYPSITVPGGYTAEGKPVGITFTAGAYAEPALVSLAYGFEQATAFRCPPRLG